MMLPEPRSTMCRPKIWHASIRPFKFTEMIRSNSSSEMSKNGVGEFTPAPLTKMSTRPNFASTSVSKLFQPGLGSGVAGKIQPGRPLWMILSSRAFALAASRPTSATAAPARAKPSAIAPHNSPVPPMTTATRPCSENNSADVFIKMIFVSARQHRTPETVRDTPTTRAPGLKCKRFDRHPA